MKPGTEPLSFLSIRRHIKRIRMFQKAMQPVRRILMIIAWTFGVYLSSTIILVAIDAAIVGFAIGICLGIHYDVHVFLATHRSLLVATRDIIRILRASLAAAAFFLALRGRLPGTKI